MKEKEFPKKIGSLFPKKRKEMKFKTFPINFKVIPTYNELFERIIQRKLILHSHETFVNEKTNIYNETYLDILYDNLYKKKRNASFSKLINNTFENNLSLDKNNYPIITKSQSLFKKDDKSKKIKKFFLKSNLNDKANKMSKEHIDFFKKNKSVDLSKYIKKNNIDDNKENENIIVKNKSEQKIPNQIIKKKGIKSKLKKFKILPPPLRIYHP
jgi:hypothetical protein